MIRIILPIRIPPPNSRTLAKIADITSMPSVLTAAVDAVNMEKNIIAIPTNFVSVKVSENMPSIPILAGKLSTCMLSSSPASMYITNFATK